MPLTILLADDSMTAQNLGKKILLEAGYDVVTVSNGAAAVKRIAERKPDLAILDVYMPGYTGLEVCERLRGAHETSGMPVLLTVGKMEMGSFKPEESARVRADGVIIKPFEASDLLAAIQKLEERVQVKGKVVATLHDPSEVPAYERTMKIPAPVFDEQDESYKAWKSEAPEHLEEVAPAQDAPRTSSYHAPTEPLEPQEILGGSPEPPAEEPSTFNKVLSKAKSAFDGAAVEEPESPAMPVDDIQTLAPTPDTAGAAYEQTIRVQPETTETVREFEKVQSFGASEAPALPPDFAVPAAVEQRPEITAAAFEAPAFEPTPVPMPAPGFEPIQSSSFTEAASAFAAALGFEPTSAPVIEPTPDPMPEHGLEPTSAPQAPEDVPVGDKDPALITDVSQMSKEFPTRFGVEGAEPVHVGIASDFPELYQSLAAEAPAAEAMPIAGTSDASSSWRAEETPLEEHEQHVSLHEEMQQQIASTAAAVEVPGPAQVEAGAEPSIAPAAHEEGPDHELAAAMAAAVGSQLEPAIASAVEQSATAIGDSTQPLDQHTAVIAEIVQRVTERLKPELIEQVLKELADLKKKES